MELTDLQKTEIKNMLNITGVIDLISRDIFKPILRPLKTDFVNKTTCECCGSVLINKGEELYQSAMKKYREDSATKHELFKYACFYETGLEYGENISKKAFEMAWSRGHSAGLHDVYYELEELADLLRTLKE